MSLIIVYVNFDKLILLQWLVYAHISHVFRLWNNEFELSSLLCSSLASFMSI